MGVEIKCGFEAEAVSESCGRVKEKETLGRELVCFVCMYATKKLQVDSLCRVKV